MSKLKPGRERYNSLLEAGKIVEPRVCSEPALLITVPAVLYGSRMSDPSCWRDSKARVWSWLHNSANLLQIIESYTENG